MKADFSKRLSEWVVELKQFLPRAAIKCQVLSKFVVEFSPLTASLELGYPKFPRKEGEGSTRILAMNEPTPEGPKILKEPP